MADHKHRFELEDRNITVPTKWDGAQTRHIHRWVARCSCGWVGPNRKHKKDARAKWVQHFRAGRRIARVSQKLPRPLTPQHKLPPELRMNDESADG